jgi:hypothetical protein
VTSRTFDVPALLNLLSEKEQSALRELSFHDKGKGEMRAVRQEWSLDYKTVLHWLKSLTGFQTKINGSYDEKEGTPRVSGPKEIAFLGDKKGD